MPQQWKCVCGLRVPITHSFCGGCGKRWDKIHKKTDPKQKARKGKDTIEPDTADSFHVPAVGFVFSGSASSTMGQPDNKPPGLNAQQKSLRSLLHQRANRIGKVESRIRKLQAALKEVQTTWPAYVQQVTQKLTQEHTKMMEFQQRATNELTELQQEMQSLLTQQLTPTNHQPESTAAQMSIPAYMPPELIAQHIPGVHVMQEQATHVMEVDAQHNTQVPGFSLPNLGEAFQQLPVMHPSINVGGLPASHVGIHHLQAAAPVPQASIGFTSVPVPNSSAHIPLLNQGYPCQNAQETQLHVSALNTTGSVVQKPASIQPQAVDNSATEPEDPLEMPPGDWNTPGSPQSPDCIRRGQRISQSTIQAPSRRDACSTRASRSAFACPKSALAHVSAADCRRSCSSLDQHASEPRREWRAGSDSPPVATARTVCPTTASLSAETPIHDSISSQEGVNSHPSCCIPSSKERECQPANGRTPRFHVSAQLTRNTLTLALSS